MTVTIDPIKKAIRQRLSEAEDWYASLDKPRPPSKRESLMKALAAAERRAREFRQAANQSLRELEAKENALDDCELADVPSLAAEINALDDSYRAYNSGAIRADKKVERLRYDLQNLGPDGDPAESRFAALRFRALEIRAELQNIANLTYDPRDDYGQNLDRRMNELTAELAAIKREMSERFGYRESLRVINEIKQ